MTNQDAIDAVIAWVSDEVVPAIVGTYDGEPPGKPQGLPDLVVDVVSEQTARDHPAFAAFSLIQQRLLHVWEIEGSIMVDAGADGDVDAALAAQRTLRGYGHDIVRRTAEDATLGGRLTDGVEQSFAAPTVGIDYRPAFVVYQDGTRGRELRFEMTVAELVEDPGF